MIDPTPCRALRDKIDEQIERTEHLVGALPEDRLDWVPPFLDAWPTGVLLGHLLDCLAGFCAVLYRADPQRLRHFAALRDLPVNHACGRHEALTRIAEYRARIQEGFAVIENLDLSQRLPTIFVSKGETLWTLLLGNLEHLTNHKHELFTRLKLMGIPVTSRDLYRFRGDAA
jgi:hypothetical protein